MARLTCLASHLQKRKTFFRYNIPYHRKTFSRYNIPYHRKTFSRYNVPYHRKTFSRYNVPYHRKTFSRYNTPSHRQPLGTQATGFQRDEVNEFVDSAQQCLSNPNLNPPVLLAQFLSAEELVAGHRSRTTSSPLSTVVTYPKTTDECRTSEATRTPQWPMTFTILSAVSTECIFPSLTKT